MYIRLNANRLLFSYFLSSYCCKRQSFYSQKLSEMHVTRFFGDVGHDDSNDGVSICNETSLFLGLVLFQTVYSRSDNQNILID